MEEQHFLRRIAKPKNCTLCFGVPTDRAGFFARKNRQNSVVDQSDLKIDGYFDALHEVMPAYRKLGVAIIEYLTLEKFSEVLSQGFQVVTLCSHWTGEEQEPCFIEFEEGFQPVEQVVEAIPETFTGILDLSVCTAVSLAEQVKLRFDDRVLVLCSGEKVIFEHWLRFYKQLYKRLSRKRTTYLDAHCGLVETILKAYH